MSWKRFPYTDSIADFDTYEMVSQPFLTVDVSYGNPLSIPIDMLVDSGGWDTLIHADIAKALEIDLTGCPVQKIGGITGVTEGYVHPVTIKIKELKDTFDVNALFVPKLGTTSILGQKDFFPRYYVKFDKSTSNFYLMKVPTLRFE